MYLEGLPTDARKNGTLHVSAQALNVYMLCGLVDNTVLGGFFLAILTMDNLAEIAFYLIIAEQAIAAKYNFL